VSALIPSLPLLATTLPTWADLGAVAAPLALIAVACLVLLLEVAGDGARRTHLAWLTAAGAMIAAFLAYRAPTGVEAFGGALRFDGAAQLLTLTLAFVLAIAVLVAPDYLRARGIERGEFYGLAALGTAGLMVLVASQDLLTVFVALETASIATYALAALRRDQAISAEAALKYLLLGAFSSALFLYGAALLYVSAGSLRFEAVAGAPVGVIYLAGATLTLVGLAFKVGAVPFHMWTPDVYEGAPTPVTGFMAAAFKLGAFGVLLRLASVYAPLNAQASHLVGWIFFGLAAASLLVGNFLAMVQGSVKRILAYSSIAHAGYTLLAVTAGAWIDGPVVTESVLSYLFVYGLTAVGAFAVVALVEGAEGTEAGAIERLAGLGARSPALALAMVIFLFSLAGIPPTGGFIVKLQVFSALFQAAGAASAEAAPWLFGLGVFGVLTSVAAVYYYLRVVAWMYMEPGEAPIARLGASVKVGLVAAALAVLALGVVPGAFGAFAREASGGPAPAMAARGE